MRILIAPDSFKECLSAPQVAEAMADGIRRAFPDADIDLVPMADGGEGTVDALVAADGGSYVHRDVTGPLGDPVRARYGLIQEGAAAVIEMAAASGLALVPPDRRDPRITTTRGVGELIADALDRGVRRILVGLGGSATNDAGAGMAQALGYRLLDASGHDLPPGGAALADIARIDASDVHPALAACTVQAACDVVNPLCGPLGASEVYGPQKGASPEAVRDLDRALALFANCIRRDLGISVRALSGGGAAGGLGAGLVAFANAELRSGVELVAEACRLEARLAHADLCLTGEGRLDGQTAHGKTPVGVAEIAARAGVPVIALAGALGPDFRTVYDHGVTAVFSIADGPMPRDAALARAASLLADAAENAVRLACKRNQPDA